MKERISDNEQAAVRCLVRARDALNEIRQNEYLKFDETKCDTCGIEGKHPKSHWVAEKACEGAWTRINRALKEFGAGHLVPQDFKS